MPTKEKEEKIYKYKILVSWILVIIWALVIFYLSSRTAAESTVQSQGMIYTFSGVFGVTIDSEELLENVDGIVRESAHGVEYFILGVLVFNAIYLCLNYRKQEELLLEAQTGIVCRDRFRVLNAVILSLLVCAIYAISDEIHQIPIPGRAFQLMDLAIDVIGILAGIIITLIIIKYKNKKATISSYTHQE